MASDNDRFVWAISFLDLFTCALGGVFVLTLLSVREKAEHTVHDPGAYLFVTARFEPGLSPDARDQLDVSLPDGFEKFATDPKKREENVVWTENGRMVVISARVPFGAEVESTPSEIKLPAKPTELRFGTETGPKPDDAKWTKEKIDALSEKRIIINGRRYELHVTWRQ